MFFSVLLNVAVFIGVALPPGVAVCRRCSCTFYCSIVIFNFYRKFAIKECQVLLLFRKSQAEVGRIDRI
jgi:hypothetical protein